MNLNPETLHGTHYTETQFDAEIENRLQEQIENDGADWDEGDRSSYKRHFLKQVYAEWNPGTDSDDFINFEHRNSLKYTGYATMGFTKAEDDNPLLAPIHGISLDDYAAITMNINGTDDSSLFKAFGIDEVIWQEINTLWPKRMQEDNTFTIVSLYGQAFSTAPNHPTILEWKNGGSAPVNNGNAENLERLKTDKYYYLELEAARTAAYQYGIDGAKWIENEFGINLTDFQSIAMQWMTKRNENFDSNQLTEDHNFQQVKTEEYKAKFATEQGGNIADDIEF